MTSERLTYQRVSAVNLDDFHALIHDVHVRQYLCDGNVFPLEWSEERMGESRALFESRGVDGVIQRNQLIFIGIWRGSVSPASTAWHSRSIRSAASRGFACAMIGRPTTR